MILAGPRVQHFGLVVAQLNRIRLQLRASDGVTQRGDDLLKGLSGYDRANHMSSICRASDNQAPTQPLPGLIELVLMAHAPPFIGVTCPAPERLNLLVIGEPRPSRCSFVRAADERHLVAELIGENAKLVVKQARAARSNEADF